MTAPALGFYIPRAEMPQVDDVADCCEWFERRGVGNYINDNAAPTEFRNHQHVLIDPERAAAIPPEAFKAPILVAFDGFIIDGNHRWAIAKERGTPIDARIVECRFGEALTMLAQYPRVRHEGGER